MKHSLIPISLVTSLFLTAHAHAAAGTTPSSSQAHTVRSITIKSESDAVRPPPMPLEETSELIITHSGHHYVTNGKIIATKDVNALLSALQAPPIPIPTLSGMGLTPDWLAEHVDAALKSQKDMFDVMYAIPAQLELFRKTFINPQKVQKLLPDICNPPIPQDAGYRQINIEVKTESGEIFEAEAHSLAPLMVPWTIKHNGKTMKTWNIHISRAIRKLIPKHFLNADQLSDGQLEYSLAEATLDSIRDKWGMLAVKHYAPALITSLQNNYRLEHVELTFYYDDNLQPYKKYREKSSSRVLDVMLSRPAYPNNLKIYFDALNEGRNAHAPDSGMVNRYVQNVLNAPWIARQISKHPDWLFGLHITQHGSLTESGLMQFAMDMREAGHPELIERVRKHLKSISYLIPGAGPRFSVGYARWLIFPDHSAILWRAFSDWSREEWLGFDPKQFVGHDCNDNSGNCPAALIEPDGKIAPGYGRK